MHHTNWFKTMLAALLLCLLAAPCLASHGPATEPRTGILLVAFGTSVPEAQVAFEQIEADVRRALPGVEIRWAFTSSIIRHKLIAEGHSDVPPSPALALAQMLEDGFTHVAVQSLHTIPGEEYEALAGTVAAFAAMPESFERITLGAPMLMSYDDMVAAAQALLAQLPAERTADEAVVFMGHGTPHPANVYYLGMQDILSGLDPLAFVGTVEGAPTLDDVMTGLDAAGVRTVWLVPFMSVAGDHARNDMAGPEDDSWLSILTARGYACKTVLHGTAEYPRTAALWVDHLKAAFAQLEN